VTFSLPYLLNAPYANLGSKVGFIFGSIACVSILFAYFIVPDCKGRSLEEIDRLFSSGIPARRFHKEPVDIQEETVKDTAVEIHIGRSKDVENID
jgi:MFS transporter, SP family, sugar:H+ symporter